MFFIVVLHLICYLKLMGDFVYNLHRTPISLHGENLSEVIKKLLVKLTIEGDMAKAGLYRTHHLFTA